MKKKKTLASLLLQQNILSILLLTFVVIGVWVGFSIYFTYKKTTIAPTDVSLIAPLTPRLDGKLFDTLSARLTWTEEELSSFTPSITVTEAPSTPTPRPTTQPLQAIVASESATPTSSTSAIAQ